MNSDIDRLRTLSIDQLAEILGRSVRWIERQLSAGTFPIQPIQGLNPAGKRQVRRWSPFVVQAFLEQNGREVSKGRHYFGSAKAAVAGRAMREAR